MHPKVIKELHHQVKKSYAVIAGEFDQTRRHPWPEFEKMIRRLPEAAHVLDAGCGNGRLLEALQKKSVHYLGFDQSPELIASAQKKHPRAHFQVADMSTWNYPAQTFDAVFCIAAFHHLPGRALRQKVAGHFYKTLKPGGLLCLTVWDLFQWRYAGAWLRALISPHAWNDLLIPWGKEKIPRYYHAFTNKELLSLFPASHWVREDSFRSRYNKCLILRKK